MSCNELKTNNYAIHSLHKSQDFFFIDLPKIQNLKLNNVFIVVALPVILVYQYDIIIFMLRIIQALFEYIK